MEKARTLIVTVTAWLSFLTAVWLFLFRMVSWQTPVIMFAIMFVAFGLASVEKSK